MQVNYNLLDNCGGPIVAVLESILKESVMQFKLKTIRKHLVWGLLVINVSCIIFQPFSFLQASETPIISEEPQNSKFVVLDLLKMDTEFNIFEGTRTGVLLLSKVREDSYRTLPRLTGYNGGPYFLGERNRLKTRLGLNNIRRIETYQTEVEDEFNAQLVHAEGTIQRELLTAGIPVLERTGSKSYWSFPIHYYGQYEEILFYRRPEVWLAEVPSEKNLKDYLARAISSIGEDTIKLSLDSYQTVSGDSNHIYYEITSPFGLRRFQEIWREYRILQIESRKLPGEQSCVEAIRLK